ncbi:hypothetical protein D9757_006934 [Collybiopsis confluens]|uniref:Uncharacterized protein n=1 Tax=Collybiopsis confluens TaxID=2823264 RepID=A0A8H5HIF9_9AGAR|nr:hypothetical protein D9757_006934 [Collybiopsis confluens]
MDEETEERKKLTSIEEALRKAREAKSELTQRMKEYDSIMGRIDALYGLIFNGPTPGFSNEDDLEQAVQASISVVHRARTEYSKESEAFDILSRSDRTFKECQSKLKDAIYWATALAMLAGGRTAEAKETSSLRIAHSLAQKAQSLVRDAQQYSAHVRTLENPSIARELPVRKENETEFHEVLKKLAAELGNTYAQLLSERKACADRTADCKASVVEAEQSASDRKRELHELRKATFLDVVSKLKSGEIAEPTESDFEGTEEAPPPSYEQQDFGATVNYHHHPSMHLHLPRLNTLSISSAQNSPMQAQAPLPLPLELRNAKQEHSGPFRQIAAEFVAPPYDVGIGRMVESDNMGVPSPSSSSFSPLNGSTGNHAHARSSGQGHLGFFDSEAGTTPTTPSTSRPSGARTRTRPPRPLPRVPQPNTR